MIESYSFTSSNEWVPLRVSKPEIINIKSELYSYGCLYIIHERFLDEIKSIEFRDVFSKSENTSLYFSVDYDIWNELGKPKYTLIGKLDTREYLYTFQLSMESDVLTMLKLML